MNLICPMRALICPLKLCGGFIILVFIIEIDKRKINEKINIYNDIRDFNNFF